MEYNVIDLFCGIGGLSYGLKKSGFNILAGIDVDNSCKYAYESNVKAEFIGSDIKKINGLELIDKYWKDNKKILVGCAPCQPFSTHSNKIKNNEDSDKWNLLNEFSRLVREADPEIVSMENVPNLINKQIFINFEKELVELGYYVSYNVVYCPDYGIPQKRRRLVLLASKYGNISLIPKTHLPKNYKTVRKAIGKLPQIKDGEIYSKDILHRSSELSQLNKKRVISSKPNGTWKDWDESLLLDCHKKESGKTYTSVYGRMSWDEPSPTITTQFFSIGTGRFGHPEQNRALSLREGAILQTFPKSYKLYKKDETFSIKNIATHIGNAVPVDLGVVIGKSIENHLKEYGKI